MRARAATALVLAAVAAPAVAAAPPQPVPVPGGPVVLSSKAAATAAALPSTHGARPVELVVKLRTELRCGRLGSRAVLVTLPASVHLPAAISRSSVWIGGGRPASVAVDGRTVALAQRPPAGMICDVLAPGTVSIVFTRAAGLGNPASPGRVRVGVVAGTATATATLVVS